MEGEIYSDEYSHGYQVDDRRITNCILSRKQGSNPQQTNSQQSRNDINLCPKADITERKPQETGESSRKQPIDDTPPVIMKGIIKTEDCIWRDDAIYYFISQWQNEPCLFDVNHPEHHLKDRRILAIERIVENMSTRQFGPLPTIQNILDKMNSLRTYYNSQTNKHKASKSSGIETKIKWKFYDSLEFLRVCASPRNTISTNDDEEGESTPPLLPPPPKKPKGNNQQDASITNSLINEATSMLKHIKNISQGQSDTPVVINETKTDDALFGETLGRSLSKIPDCEEKDYLKLELQRMVLKLKYSQQRRQVAFTPKDL